MRLANSLRLALAAILSLALVAPATAQSMTPQNWALQAASTYNWGCYPPCLCPIFFGGEVQGDFTTIYNTFDGTYDVYDIPTFTWEVVGVGGTITSLITGTGSLRRTPFNPASTPAMQQLILDVDIDGTLHTLDSEVQPITTPDDQIVLALSQNGFFCMDYVINLDAAMTTVSPATQFIRGDCNENGTVDLADAVAGLGILFTGAAPPDCLEACDCNDDGSHNLADVVYELTYLFNAGPLMPLPFPTCGSDSINMPCTDFAACP